MDADTKACPLCGESIKAKAVRCRFCNSDLAVYAANREYEIENALFSGHPAVIYTASQIVPFMFLAAIAGVLAYYLRSFRAGLYVTLGFVLACGIVYLRFYLRSVRIHYTITTQRIKVERGIFSKIQESLELFRVDHLELRKPIGKRLLRQASLHVFSSDAEFQNFFVNGVPNLEVLANTLRECQLRERVRRSLTTFVKA